MTKISLDFSHLYPHCKTVNMFDFTKRKNSDIQGGWTGSSRLRLWSRVQHTLFCREISYVANDDEGWGDGSRYPPKMKTLNVHYLCSKM